LSPPDLPSLLGKARELTARYQAGGVASFEAYRQLLTLIFGLTVMRQPQGYIQRQRGADEDRETIGPSGWPNQSLPLNGGALLRFGVALYLGETDKAPGKRVLKVANESFALLVADDEDSWVFRYEYEREPRGIHPKAHLHIRGSLSAPAASALGEGKTLERVRFPTGRVSVPAMINVLAEEFEIPTNQVRELWRPVLMQVESDFQLIAHHPTSEYP
jgi:hypothetical protein